MIGVTERAKAELKAMLAAKVDNSQACLRIRTGEDGKLGLGIDIEMPGDEKVEYQGAVLLVAEKALADKLNRITIDVEDTDEGSRLVVVEAPA